VSKPPASTPASFRQLTQGPTQLNSTDKDVMDRCMKWSVFLVLLSLAGEQFGLSPICIKQQRLLLPSANHHSRHPHARIFSQGI
jgi:hypothetical protein